VAVSFIGGGNLSKYQEKTTDLPKATHKLYHKMLYQIYFTMSGIRTLNFGGDRH